MNLICLIVELWLNLQQVENYHHILAVGIVLYQIKPADIKPSTIIKTREPIPEPEPPKPVIKPDEVAPPTTGRSKFYKKLKDTASTVADAASSELGTAIIESAINEIDKSHVASSLVGSALRGHRGRKQNTTEYTGIQTERPSTNVSEAIAKLQAVAKRKTIQPIFNEGIKNARAAIKIQSAIRNKNATKAVTDKYIAKQYNAASKIQGLSRGIKTRNALANDIDFQDKIEMKIKKYGDAASEYKTRGKYDKDINNELKDILKINRTGLQQYKATLGKKPKKRGPKTKSKYLSGNELEV
jgi:hypothetical protein